MRPLDELIRAIIRIDEALEAAEPSQLVSSVVPAVSQNRIAQELKISNFYGTLLMITGLPNSR